MKEEFHPAAPSLFRVSQVFVVASLIGCRVFIGTRNPGAPVASNATVMLTAMETSQAPSPYLRPASKGYRTTQRLTMNN